MKNGLKLILTVIFTVMFFTGLSYATTISSVATDLTDATAGEDLWQYEYTVSDNTFNEDEAFTIWFDVNLYEQLTPISADSNWDVFVAQPEPLFTPEDGFYDAMALSDGASLADTFVVSFVWLGTDAPGVQLFDVYDVSTLDILEFGETSAPVPEPGTIILLALGLLGIAGFGRKENS